MKLKPLAEQVIVVFGASSGIGRTTARLAAEGGARVVAAGRDEVALASLAGKLSQDRIAIGTADAANFSEVARIADLAIERFGRIDTWAHIAGIGEWAAILDAAQHPRRDVIVGSAARLQLALQKISPRLVDLMTRTNTWFRAEQSSEAKQPGDDALFEPPHGDTRERGPVTTLHR